MRRPSWGWGLRCPDVHAAVWPVLEQHVELLAQPERVAGLVEVRVATKVEEDRAAVCLARQVRRALDEAAALEDRQQHVLARLEAPL